MNKVLCYVIIDCFSKSSNLPPFFSHPDPHCPLLVKHVVPTYLNNRSTCDVRDIAADDDDRNNGNNS